MPASNLHALGKHLRPMPNEKEVTEMCLAEMTKSVPKMDRAVRKHTELVARWRNLQRLAMDSREQGNLMVERQNTA